MNPKILIQFFLLVWFVFASFVEAQTAQCISRIQKRLDVVGTADFDFNQARQVVKDFDFGKTREFVNDSAKRTAFQRIFTSMSEFLDLAPNDLSGKALKGYTRFSGGIIRKNGTDFVTELKHVFGGTNSFDGKGFGKVMEHLETRGAWPSQGSWQSPGGLVYETMTNNQGHRISHVFDHTVPNPSKPNHSIFSVKREEVLDLVDEAFSKAQQHGTDTLRFEAELGRVIGTAGETKMRVVVNPNTKKIITAFPLADADVTVPGI